MSEFSSAVTAVEMAVKALGLEGQISVEMDSDDQCIILDRTISLQCVQGSGVVVGSIDTDEMEAILTTDDVVEAVIEAMAQVVAQQARSFLYSIFEAVDDDEGLEDDS